MNCIIPYTKEITFSSKIREITSISLEHEMNINNGEILGNFIISGEYKAHELSVNKESFEYVLPFSIDLNERVIEETVEFNITDFSYEILNDNVLKVMIEFTVFGEEKEEDDEEIFIKPESDDDVIEIVEEREELEELSGEENKEEIIPEVEVIEETVVEDIKEEVLEKVNEEEMERDVVDNTMVNETINKAVDTYKTYHVHIVKENENLEMICEKYKSSKDIIQEYNDLSEIIPGDKLIIPEDD